MLTRTLEPEVMDSREDAWDYDTMDHGEVNRRFVDDVLAAGLIPGGTESGGTESPRATRDYQSPDLSSDLDADDDRPPLLVLDLGAGTAQIPILLCQATEDVQVMAADAAVSMLDLARLNVEIAGLRERIQLDHADCAPAWAVLEAALFDPGRAVTVVAASGQRWAKSSIPIFTRPCTKFPTRR